MKLPPAPEMLAGRLRWRRVAPLLVSNALAALISLPVVAQVTDFPDGSGPLNMAAGSDGNLWYTEFFASKIGRITTTGTAGEFSIPSNASGPYGITSGPDGNFGFTEQSSNK